VGIALKIVFDNELAKEGLQPKWGFACAIEGEQGLYLFDTGSDAVILFSNMKKMGLNPADVRLAVISHSHYDHAGGLLSLPTEARSLKIYLPPDGYPEGSKRHLVSCGADPVLGENGQEISPGFFLIHTKTGGVREQSLALRLETGLVLMTGCAHPGIVEIVRNVRDTLEAPPELVVGGLHLRGDEEEAFRGIAASLLELGLKRIAPTHCTEETAREVLRTSFGDGYIEAGLGSVIETG
jgi:7,8-dihydropterin-6-yl-methyl-4-(beta-D-ribofuranosyl)aminobenzene 5'-phosphate synthase